ncbi:MAG TPA: TfuA-like protein [Thermoanaerobaculia bacterium]|nr:TfuA-like protein [Thermoanaerobaculia bacterium]
MSPPAVFVFTGPTLPAEEGRALLDAVYLPPVSQGDVYRAARERPWAIAIVDGYFGRIPAVWHKEILWAMSQGIHVFGAASMGALRAAELAPFGMEGVGAVFEAFRDGLLTDDDEVTVVHGPATSGYRALSEALVNIRFTLEAAVAAGVLPETPETPEQTRQALLALAKSTFYPQRSWPALLKNAQGKVPEADLAALAAWLPGGRVDQKGRDARALLAHVAARREVDPAPKMVRFRFQHTDAWEEARRQAAERPLDAAAGADTLPPDALLDELRHAGGPERYPAERERALSRALALEVARLQGLSAPPARIEETADAFRRARGLHEPEALARFLAEQGLSPEGFYRLMRDEVLESRVRSLAAAELPHHLHDRLRASGDYGPLKTRSRDKQAALAARGLDNPAVADCDLPLPELWRWYFEERLGKPVPADLAVYARSLDLPGEETLLRTVLRERQFCRLSR